MTYFTKLYTECVTNRVSLPITMRFFKVHDELDRPAFAQEDDPEGWRAWMAARFWFLPDPPTVVDVYAVKLKQSGYDPSGCEVILYRMKTDDDLLEPTMSGDVFARWGPGSDIPAGVCPTPASVLLQGDQ